jgi:hypothetical protein
VDDDVTAGEQCAGGFVELEAIPPDIAADRRETPCDLTLEATPELGAKAVETVVPDDLTACSVLGGETLTWPDKDDNLATRHAPEEALDERGSQETRRPRHRDALAGEIVSDHKVLSSIACSRALGLSTHFFSHEASRLLGSGSGCTAGGWCLVGFGGV